MIGANFCTYVGRNGVALLSDQLGMKQLNQILVFKDAEALHVSLTEVIRNINLSREHYLTYKFVWTNQSGEKLLKLEGNVQLGWLSRRHVASRLMQELLNFGYAAQVAWTFHLMDRMKKEMSEGQPIRFTLGKKDWVELSKGRIVFRLSRTTYEHSAEDIEGFRLEEGGFQVRTAGAKKGWFSSEGIYHFSYSRMANALLFVTLFDELIGIKSDL